MFNRKILLNGSKASSVLVADMIVGYIEEMWSKGEYVKAGYGETWGSLSNTSTPKGNIVQISFLKDPYQGARSRISFDSGLPYQYLHLRLEGTDGTVYIDSDTEWDPRGGFPYYDYYPYRFEFLRDLDGCALKVTLTCYI